MNNFSAQSKLLLQLLIQGIRIDLAYSIVVILVIASMFSTPLILGSIKNKVYVAVKEQVEKENNAREITIQQADSSGKHRLDNEFLRSLQNNEAYRNKYKIVGNYQHVVMIEGPKGAQLLTLDTLVPEDPRTEFLQIKKQIPDKFGLFDLIISDSLGQLLYGKEEWSKLWNSDFSQFSGSPLSMSVNDTPVKNKFKVVARQTAPGVKVYGSTKLGESFKKYSVGLGADELGLPIVRDLVQYALPKFETLQCIVVFPNEQCNSEQQNRIMKRMKADNFEINPIEDAKKIFESASQIQVMLTKLSESEGHVEIKPTKGDCEARLYHQLDTCPASAVIPDISIKTEMITKKMKLPVRLSGITPRSYDLLTGIQKLRNQHGGNMSFENDGILKKGIEIAAPYRKDLQLGESVQLQVGTELIPAFISSYYQCAESDDCPFYVNAKTIFRLQNVADGMAVFEQRDSSLFYPVEKYIKTDYDKILFYANQVEEVEILYRQLKERLSDYSVNYNVFAINKLKRQDQQLSKVFSLSLILSVIFIIFAVGALAKVNIDKRKRQMAQMFILGYSKLFVGILLICEYTVLTVLASVTAIGTGWAVFKTVRYFLQSSAGSASTEFKTIIDAMTLDIGAFINVFVIVVLLTTGVATFAAYLASKSDPVTLLD